MESMRTENDVELLWRYVEEGDQDAFAEIVSRHRVMVYRVCFRKLLNRHDAEDATQAVFMALMNKSGKMKRKGSLANWLFVVARQTALFAARSRVRRKQRETATADIHEIDASLRSTDEDSELILGFLDDELAALSGKQREAVVLRYLDGLSEKEAAVAAGCSPNALSSRLGDGIATLRKRLARRGLALGFPVLIACLEAEAKASIPQTLIPSLTVSELSASLASNPAVASTPTSQLLMKGTLKTMAIKKSVSVGVAIIIALLIGSSAIMAIMRNPEKETPRVKEKKTKPAGSSLASNTKKSKPSTQKKRSNTKINKRSVAARNFLAEAEKAWKNQMRETLAPRELLEIFRDWYDYDKEAAWAWATKPHQHREELIAAFMSNENPDAAVAWISKNGMTAYWKANGLIAIGRECFLRDSEATIEWAMNLPKGGIRTLLLGGIVKQWGIEDPAAVEKWIMESFEGKEKSCLLSMAAQGIADENPADAAELLKKIPEKHFYQRGEIGYRTQLGLSVVTSKWVKTDSKEAVAWVENLPESARSRVLRALVTSWGGVDFKGAADWTLQLPEGKYRDRLLTQYLAGRYRKKALEWGLTLPEGNDRNKVLTRLIPEWARQNLEDAMSWAERLPEGESRNKAICKIARFLAREGADMDAALDLLNKLPDDSQAKKSMLSYIASNLCSGKDSEEALKLVMAQKNYGALTSVVRNWAEKDPKAAASWIERLKIPNDKRNTYINGIGKPHTRLEMIFSSTAYVWASKNPKAAAEWAEQLPEGGEKAMALSTVAATWIGQDTEGAANWVEGLPDEKSKEQTIFETTSAWAEKDHAAAKNWVESLSLPEEKLKIILKKIKQFAPPEDLD